MKENSPKISKKVILLAVAMMLWPIVLLLVNMISIYSLVGTSSIDGPSVAEEQAVNARLAVATAVNMIVFYLGPVSFIGGIVLLIMKSRR